MTPRAFWLVIAAAVICVPAGAFAGTAGALPFTPLNGVDEGAADNISSLVSSELDIAGDWELVISASADEITDGCGDDKSCWQAFGKGEGHDHVITGTVDKAGEEYKVTTRLYEVGSGRLVREVVKNVSRKPGLLLDQIPVLAAELATGEKVEEEDDGSAEASKPKFDEPTFDDEDEFGEEEDEDEADKPKWMNRDRRGRLIRDEDYDEDEDDPFGDLGDEDLDLDELDADTQRKKADSRREREAREAAVRAEQEDERRRVAEERRRREEEDERRRVAEERRREEERRAAEEDSRRREQEERQARAERERRDELRRLSEEREREEEEEQRRIAKERRREEERRAEKEREREEEDRRRRAEAREREEQEERGRAAEERRREDERKAAAEERRREGERRASSDRRRDEERRRVEDERREEERRAEERRRAEVARYEDEDDEEEFDEGGFALRSAIEIEDDGFVIEDDEDPGFVIEEGDEDDGFVVEEDDGPREGEVITYGEEEEEEEAPVARRRDDYDPYARAKKFERDDDRSERSYDDDEDEGDRRRERNYERRERSSKERNYDRIDRRGKDRRSEDRYDEDEDDEDEGDFDRLDAEDDDRLAYNADGYPDRRRSYDDDEDEVRARPSGDRYEDEEDDFDVSDYGDRGARSDYSSGRARARTTRRGPSGDRQWVSVRAHVGYTNYYLHFAEYGLDVGVLVHPQIAIDVTVDFWSVGLTVLDEDTGDEVQQVHTLPNFSIGGSWRGDFHKVVKPFVGADFTSTIYATVRRGTPDGPVEPRGSVGFMIKGGADFMFLRNLGAHFGVKGGVMHAEDISELVSAEWGPTQGVVNINGGLTLRF